MKLAVRHLQFDYPKVYFQGCAAHSLDLLLHNWGKEAWVEKIVTKAKLVVNFIKNHHATFAAYMAQSPNLQLILHVPTRFGSNFLMLDRLFEVKTAFGRVVASDAWTTYMTECQLKGDVKR